MAGYSGTPLAKKLGIQAEHRVAVLDLPGELPAGLDVLPPGVQLQRGLAGRQPFDVIVLFSRNKRALLRRLPGACARLRVRGGLWIAWPKKASAVATDLHGDVVREAGLATGLVDNKVCAIDEVWSGLRFVVRREDRG